MKQVTRACKKKIAVLQSNLLVCEVTLKNQV